MLLNFSFYETNYTLETTFYDAASENRLSDKLNHTLSGTVHCLLYNSGLPSTYWDDIYLHSIYLKNIMVHSTIKTTSYQAYYGVPQDLHHILSTLEEKHYTPDSLPLEPYLLNQIGYPDISFLNESMFIIDVEHHLNKSFKSALKYLDFTS